MSAVLDVRVLATLERLSVAFETLECAPELADTARFCEHYGYALENSANTIVIVTKKAARRYVACVLLADSRLDVNRSVRKRLGVRRLSFASDEETRDLTGMELGGVTPLALPDNLPLWVDARVMSVEFVILGGGNRTSKLKVSPEIFNRLPNADIVDGLALAPMLSLTDEPTRGVRRE